MNIRPARSDDLDAFFSYLGEHLAENGQSGRPLFQPLAADASNVSPALVQSFAQGLTVPLAYRAWRTLWLAWDDTHRVAGHIDLRHTSEPYTGHRLLLGMGVARAFRRQGVGRSLMQTAMAYCREHDNIVWLDLWVLSGNEAARRLYENCGFHTLGDIPDKFRIDGQSHGYTLMSQRMAV